MLAALKKEKLRNPPGTRFVYSDIGFIVLGEIVHRVSDLELFQFFSDTVAKRVGLSDSHFTPKTVAVGNDPILKHIEKGPYQRYAPTENIRGQNSYLGATFDGSEDLGKQILRAIVHDPTAFRMSGFAGHAGLFSTADDLARYAQMLLNGGVARLRCRSPRVSKGVVHKLAETPYLTGGPRQQEFSPHRPSPG